MTTPVLRHYLLFRLHVPFILDVAPAESPKVMGFLLFVTLLWDYVAPVHSVLKKEAHDIQTSFVRSHF